MPSDVAVDIEGNRVDHSIENLPIEAPIFDMGITSVRALSRAIKSAGTIILNGPAGVFERTDFALGTVEMLNACAEGDGYAVMGGGHTATSLASVDWQTRWGTSQPVAVLVWNYYWKNTTRSCFFGRICKAV